MIKMKNDYSYNNFIRLLNTIYVITHASPHDDTRLIVRLRMSRLVLSINNFKKKINVDKGVV